MIWLAFIFGLVTSLHCTLMCAPLQAMAMGKFLGGTAYKKVLLYHGGRIATYAALGVLIGILGQSVNLQNWQQEFSIIAGLSLLLGYFSLKILRWDRKINSLITPYLIRIQSRNYQRKNQWRYLIGGSINGLLPCGMVYAALIPAAAAGQPQLAALAMLMFGLGTLPVLVGLNLTGGRILYSYPNLFNRLLPIGVVVVSSLLILRGMDLGIPFLSPSFPADINSPEVCK